MDQSWRRLDDISPHLIRAAMAGEDAKFCRHHGFDWGAIATAWNRYQGGHERGAFVIFVELRIGIVDLAFGDIEPDFEVLAHQPRELPNKRASLADFPLSFLYKKFKLYNVKDDIRESVEETGKYCRTSEFEFRNPL